MTQPPKMPINPSMPIEEKKNKTFTESKGNWRYSKCHNLNFAFRLICNMCKLPLSGQNLMKSNKNTATSLSINYCFSKNFSTSSYIQSKKTSTISPTNLPNAIQSNTKTRTFAMGFTCEIDIITNYIQKAQIQASTDSITSLRFHSDKLTTILAITSIGEVFYLHSISKRMLSQFAIKDTALRALDYNAQGDQFVIGPSIGEVLVYNENMQILKHCFKSGASFAKGHVDQVRSVLFSNSDPNAVISGGRDKLIVLWDKRCSIASEMIVGPFIMGDSIDVKWNVLLTGSYDINEGIQLWDLRMLKVIKEYKSN